MMDRKQIEQWAREAGVLAVVKPNDPAEQYLADAVYAAHLSLLGRFAALVAAHEREQCALVCDAMGNPWRGSEDCAAVIRERGEA